MTPFTLMAWEGALVCTACGLFALCVAIIVTVHWINSNRWERFCRVCGGPKKALAALKFSEACRQQDADKRIDSGFRTARAQRWLDEEPK